MWQMQCEFTLELRKGQVTMCIEESCGLGESAGMCMVSSTGHRPITDVVAWAGWLKEDVLQAHASIRLCSLRLLQLPSQEGGEEDA